MSRSPAMEKLNVLPEMASKNIFRGSNIQAIQSCYGKQANKSVWLARRLLMREQPAIQLMQQEIINRNVVITDIDLFACLLLYKFWSRYEDTYFSH